MADKLIVAAKILNVLVPVLAEWMEARHFVLTSLLRI
jgi:hypothetical protein